MTSAPYTSLYKTPGEFYTRGKWPAVFIKKATERQGLHLKVFDATELVRGADKLTSSTPVFICAILLGVGMLCKMKKDKDKKIPNYIIHVNKTAWLIVKLNWHGCTQQHLRYFLFHYESNKCCDFFLNSTIPARIRQHLLFKTKMICLIFLLLK